MKTNEIIKVIEKQNRALLHVNNKYLKAIFVLDKSRSLLESQLKSNLQIVLSFFPLMVPLFLFIILMFFIHTIPCGVELKVKELEVKKSCVIR